MKIIFSISSRYYDVNMTSSQFKEKKEFTSAKEQKHYKNVQKTTRNMDQSILPQISSV